MVLPQMAEKKENIVSIKVYESTKEILDGVIDGAKRQYKRKLTQPDVVEMWRAAAAGEPAAGISTRDEKLLRSLDTVSRSSMALGELLRNLIHTAARELTIHGLNRNADAQAQLGEIDDFIREIETDPREEAPPGGA